MNILCIDDEPLTLRLYEALLEEYILPGDQLFFAENAEKGFDIFNHKLVHVVITDLVMPGKNGLC